jgi:ribosomal protein S18 acetylase RimI-like enzyme
LEICSLTVDPNYFRRGIADKLINHVLDSSDCVEAVVETAIANTPAIKLYEKHGFIEYRRWKTSHGISKLAMLVKISL